MIVFINKGFSLFPYLESKGVFLEQLDNEWISNSPDELVNKLIVRILIRGLKKRQRN